jgi:uncharacterized membrane protein
VSDFFAQNAMLIVFLRVLSAVIWIGGMIAMRFSVHRALGMIEEPRVRVQTAVFGLERFLWMAMAALFVLLFTGLIMMLALKASPLYTLTHVKSTILVIMAVIYFTAFFKQKTAKRQFLAGDIPSAAASLKPVAAYLIPTNIALGVVELLLGVILRGY